MTETYDEIRQLRRDLELAQRTLRQREEALAVLNRRLVRLERGRPGDRPGTSAERNALAAQDNLLTELLLIQRELELLRATKLFRYADPLRRIYAMTRRGR